jgi:hypothetical protein
MTLYIVEFNLKTRSRITVENGDVILDKGYSTVTVRNVEGNSIDDAQINARVKANAFLDELSVKHKVNLEIGNGCTISIQDSPLTRHIKKYNIKITLRGGHRERITRILQRVEVKSSDAKTYYRKAMTSTDDFDKFRNFFLAIENVVSKIAIENGQKKRREVDKLAFSLGECFLNNQKALKENMHVYGLVNTGDIVFDVATFLYKQNRVQLNHSKVQENKKLPFNSHDEWQVKEANSLAEFVAKSLIDYEDAHLPHPS